MNSLSKLLTITDLASLLQVSPQSIRKWIFQRSIPYVKVGRLIRFKPSEIDRWLNETSHKERK